MKSSVAGKSRKPNNKDKEKRKPQLVGESSSNQNADKSPSKDSGLRKYAGISSESIACMAEQVLFERLSEDACNTLAEDISFKLRQVIHNACLNMKMGKREHLKVSDVDAALKRLNVDKIYGPANPSWIPFGDQQLSYIEDTVIQLQDLAVKESVFYQPTCPVIERNWIMATPSAGVPEIPRSLVNYYLKCCQAIVSPNPILRQTALNDIKSNCKIGPVIIWFYNYVFLLLRKSITCVGLMDKALSLLEAIESNSISKLISYDQQLKLITMQLFEFMFQSINNKEINLDRIAKMMQILCSHWLEGTDKILDKILAKTETDSKIPFFYHKYASVIVTILNTLGSYALEKKLWPNLALFLPLVNLENTHNAKLRFAFYMSCNLYYENNCNMDIDKILYETFGEVVIPLRRFEIYNSDGEDSFPESNWVNIKSKLMKTQRKINRLYNTSSTKKFSRDEVFQCYCNTSNNNQKIKIKLHSYVPRCQLCKRNINSVTNGVSVLNYVNSGSVTVGKTSLLLKVNDFKIANTWNKQKKYDLLYYNL